MAMSWLPAMAMAADYGLACWPWLQAVAHGPWPMAHGPWPMAHGHGHGHPLARTGKGIYFLTVFGTSCVYHRKRTRPQTMQNNESLSRCLVSHGCRSWPWPWLPAMAKAIAPVVAAGHGCGPWLLAMAAGHGCWPWLPARPVAHGPWPWHPLPQSSPALKGPPPQHNTLLNAYSKRKIRGRLHSFKK